LKYGSSRVAAALTVEHIGDLISYDLAAFLGVARRTG
jgi:hypothetical protein